MQVVRKALSEGNRDAFGYDYEKQAGEVINAPEYDKMSLFVRFLMGNLQGRRYEIIH